MKNFQVAIGNAIAQQGRNITVFNVGNSLAIRVVIAHSRKGIGGG